LLNDMLAVERKLERLNDEAKKGSIKDKSLHAQELVVFTKLQQALAAEKPLRDVELNPAEEKLLASFGLLTRKPILVVFNTGEEKLDPKLLAAHPGAVALQGKLEMEIAQLSPEEAAEFLKEYGIEEPSLNRMIKLSYDLLG